MTSDRSSTASRTRSSLSKPRFFVEGAHAPGDRIALLGADARKILTVLRMQTGDLIDAIDSAGRTFEAALEISGKHVHATLRTQLDAQRESSVRIAVAQGIPRAQKMDFVVEKLTELGVAEIVPLASERTVADASDHKRERWARLARTAAQQSGRSDIPLIAPPKQLSELMSGFNSFDRVLFPWELAAQAPVKETFETLLQGVRSVLVVIGPEGGFSQDEAQSAQASGASVVSLGPRILRTETAGLVAVSFVNFVLGG